MTTEYTFTKTILNLDAMKYYMQKKFDLMDLTTDIDYIANDAGDAIVAVIIHTRVTVPEERITELTNLIANYTDPVYYFPGLDHIETYPIYTAKYCNISNFPIYSWIIPYRKFVLGNGKGTGPTVINEIKLLFEVHTRDISLFSNISETTFSIELFCVTDNASIVTEVVDITNIISTWNNEYTNGETGAKSSYKTMQFTNMWNKNPDYDCIRKINITSNNTNIELSLATIQYMCYKPPIYV